MIELSADLGEGSEGEDDLWPVTVISVASLFFGVGGALVWLLPETRGAEL